MSRARALAFTGILAIGSIAFAEELEPQDLVKVRRLLQSGTTHYNLTEYAVALGDFTEAYRLKPDPVFLFNMAQCHRKLGDPEKSVRFYRIFLREKPQTANRVEVERFIAEAEAALARAQQPPTTVTVTLSSEPPRPAPPVSPPVVLLPEARPLPPPPPRRSRAWVGAVAAVAGVVVVGGVVGVGLGLGLSRGGAEPDTLLGTTAAVFQ